MKRIIIGVLAAAVALTVFGSGTPASATNDTSDEEVCYETVNVYGDIIEKEVKGNIQTRDRGDWKNTGTFDWIDWPEAGPVNDDGRSRGPGGHSDTFDQTGSGNGSTRKQSTQYRYVVVGQFVKGTKQVEVPCPTVPTTIPETTVPETTVPETTIPETTVPETTVPVTVPPPVDPCPDVDGVPSYPQTYGPDAPCGPTDPCVGINPDTGLGTTLWGVQECGTPVTTTPGAAPTTAAVATSTGSLPSTGAETWIMTLLGGLALTGGFGLTRLARRR